jgi:hypothetical protein
MYTEPAKVFDDVYFMGTKDRSSWALTTSDGIILIDTTYEYETEQVIVGGLLNDEYGQSLTPATKPCFTGLKCGRFRNPPVRGTSPVWRIRARSDGIHIRSGTNFTSPRLRGEVILCGGLRSNLIGTCSRCGHYLAVIRRPAARDGGLRAGAAVCRSSRRGRR